MSENENSLSEGQSGSDVSDSVDSDGSVHQPTKSTEKQTGKRPSRSKHVPAKLKNGLSDPFLENSCDPESKLINYYHELLIIGLSIQSVSNLCTIILGVILVRCSQTGKEHAAKFHEISRQDGKLLKEDYIKSKGAKLSYHYKGKPYPVKFISFKGL